ncbi:hypothetical protein AB0I69_42550 [Streptomyces sp. NPDC050508]|uniref:hypothetical protein n=1 Tax=Streptomyces sp. NPDC050508 TaxID=3155405 RepID=UPI0034407219
MIEKIEMAEDRRTYSFAIDVQHASRFTAIRRKQRREMAEWAHELAYNSKGKITRAEARLEARRRRPELWPTLDEYVERAVRKRLAEEDLAGPWEPLTVAETEAATLSGRGFGKHYPGHLITRAYDLPPSLVRALRTAAIRVSEEPLAELDELGLLYNSLNYTIEEQEQRTELVERVLSAPRIVRQALERYGPWPPDERPPSAPPEAPKHSTE